MHHLLVVVYEQQSKNPNGVPIQHGCQKAVKIGPKLPFWVPKMEDFPLFCTCDLTELVPFFVASPYPLLFMVRTGLFTWRQDPQVP